MANVSLYNGSAEDINGYTWTIEDSAVAQLSPTGQYCELHAKKQGYTRIKVVHTKAKQPYYIGLYVFEDVGKTPYITTQENIMTMQETVMSKRFPYRLSMQRVKIMRASLHGN